MKSKLSNIVDSVEALKELAALKLKAAKTFQLAKLIKQANSELQEFMSVRTETLKKYSSDGVKVDEDKMGAAEAELRELLGKEIDLPDFSLTESELSSFDISAALLLQLEWLITKE